MQDFRQAISEGTAVDHGGGLAGIGAAGGVFSLAGPMEDAVGQFSGTCAQESFVFGSFGGCGYLSGAAFPCLTGRAPPSTGKICDLDYRVCCCFGYDCRRGADCSRCCRKGRRGCAILSVRPVFYKDSSGYSLKHRLLLEPGLSGGRNGVGLYCQQPTDVFVVQEAPIVLRCTPRWLPVAASLLSIICAAGADWPNFASGSAELRAACLALAMWWILDMGFAWIARITGSIICRCGPRGRCWGGMRYGVLPVL